MRNFQLMPNALAVGVLSVLLTACGGGVEKPDLSGTSSGTGTINPSNGGKGTNIGDTSATDANLPKGDDGESKTAGIDVFIEPFHAEYRDNPYKNRYLQEGHNDGGAYVYIDLVDSSTNDTYTAQNDLKFGYSTTCPAGTNNPAVEGTDFTIKSLYNTTIEKGKKRTSVQVLPKDNGVADDKTFCFTVTSVNGKTDHQLITQTQNGVKYDSRNANLSNTILLRDKSKIGQEGQSDTNNNNGNGNNDSQNNGNNNNTTTKKSVNPDTGMTFTKLDNTGSPVDATATEWSCFKDDNTGLVWETKDATKGKLNSLDNRYTWYNGSYGIETDSHCTGLGDKCNTKAYIEKINEQKLCGLNNWRLPTYHELFNIVDFKDKGITAKDKGTYSFPREMVNSATETSLFPNSFWTSSPMLSSRTDNLMKDNKVSYEISLLSGSSAIREHKTKNPTVPYNYEYVILVSDGK